MRFMMDTKQAWLDGLRGLVVRGGVGAVPAVWED